jgi:hypothetical protein
MRFKGNFFIFLVLIVIFLQFDNHSQTLQSEIKILSKNADVILTGKVIRQNSSWNNDRSRIYTNVVVQADEYLKGNYSEKTLSLSTPGGEVGDVGELYSHMPRFNNEEEVLVFVKRDKKDKNYKVLNGEEGKLTLYRDKNGELVTSFNKKISSLKKEIQSYINTQ